MRTNIEIDDGLMKKVMRGTGARTKRAAVEAVMRQYVQLQKQEKALKGLWGAAQWEGNLEESRLGHVED
jgi:Arc/MetJ family transcription regulator